MRTYRQIDKQRKTVRQRDRETDTYIHLHIYKYIHKHRSTNTHTHALSLTHARTHTYTHKDCERERDQHIHTPPPHTHKHTHTSHRNTHCQKTTTKPSPFYCESHPSILTHSPHHEIQHGGRRLAIISPSIKLLTNSSHPTQYGRR